MSVDPNEQARMLAVNLKALAENKAPKVEELSDNPFDEFIWEESQILMPGIFADEDLMYMTIPVMRNVKKTVGKGDEKRVQERKERQTICVRSDGTWFPFDEKTVTDEGYDWLPIFIQPASKSRWRPDFAEQFLLGKTEPPDTWDLYHEIRAIYEQYVEYPEPQHYDLLTAYVMLSYVFPVFAAVPYIHFHGTANAGKSQNLAVLKALSLNCILSSSITPAALFRTLASNIGLTAFDEAETWEGESKSEMLSMVKQGYKRGGAVIRAENQNNRWTPTEFPIYSPKVFASIAPQDYVLNTRAFVITMQPASKIIPPFDDESGIWPGMRNKLYLWAMANWKAIREKSKEIQDAHTKGNYMPMINNRQWEIGLSLMTIMEYVGGDHLAKPFGEWMAAYWKTTTANNAATDRIAVVLRAMPRLIEQHAYEGDCFYNLKDIHAVTLDYIDEDQRDHYKTRTAMRSLSTLGFTNKKSSGAGTLIQIKEGDVRHQLLQRKVDPLDEDIEWLTNEALNRQHPNAQVVAPTAIWDTVGSDESEDKQE